MTFDDYNHRFLCHNRHPLMHVVLEDRYLAHNPSLAVPAVIHDVAAEGEQSHIYPISKQWATSHLHAGQFTAACGTRHLPRRRLAGRVPRQFVHLRTDGQPGASRGAPPAGRHVHLQVAVRRPRVPGLARYLVPAGGHRKWARRGVVCRRHVSGGDRTSAVHARGIEEPARPALRRRPRPDLSHRAGRFQGQIASIRICQSRPVPTWCDCSSTAMPGGARRPPGCFTSGKTIGR